MKNQKLFQIRSKCPSCFCSESSEKLSVLMNDGDIVNFQKLEKFYTNDFWNEYSSEKFSEFYLKIVKCNKCNLYFNQYILTDNGMNLLYNKWLDQNKLVAYYQNRQMDFRLQKRIKYIIKYFNSKDEINILDFGAGYGNFIKAAKHTKCKLYAYDLSKDKNNFLEKNLGVTLVRDLEGYQEYFHYINIDQVLEHLSNPLETLIELNKCLTKDGLIYVSTPNCKGLEKLILKRKFNIEFWNKISPFQHINGFTNNTLKLILRNSELTPINIYNNFNSFRLTDVFFILKQYYHFYFGTLLHCKKKFTSSI